MAEEPVLVRMFVDDASGIAWWLPPRASVSRQTLPMSGELRERIQDWVDDYTQYVSEGLAVMVTSGLSSMTAAATP